MTQTNRTVILTSLAMMAFAANSLLCRAALRETGIDPASFLLIRFASGAAMLGLVVWLRNSRNGKPVGAGNWTSAAALFAYGAAFSFAYVSLPTATGALLLFGAVQMTMVGHGVWSGERLRRPQLVGFVLALAGLIGLLLPGLSAPPLIGAMLMLAAGVAWGVYSLRGKQAGDATQVTAGNFARAVPMAAALSALIGHPAMDVAGVGYAVMSGALASGLGYALWYTALPNLKATSAATVQLSVPIIAAVSGVLVLSEAVSLRLILASVAVLGGIALVLLEKGRARGP